MASPDVDELADAMARILASWWRRTHESRSSDSLTAGRTTETTEGDLTRRSPNLCSTEDVE
jgi:hypothetical protein